MLRRSVWRSGICSDDQPDADAAPRERRLRQSVDWIPQRRESAMLTPKVTQVQSATCHPESTESKR